MSEGADKTNFEKLMKDCPLIAILRGVTPPEIVDVCKILAGAGVSLIEIPLNSPDAIESIRLASNEFHTADDCKVMIGAGTVLTPEKVNAVADAGGKYIISPNTDTSVIKQTKARGLLSLPGFFTPSEAFVALNAGADYLKCFPAGDLGAGYIKNLKAVVPAPILAVGGVDLDNAAEFLKVAAGLGIGSSMFKPGKDLKKMAEDAADFVAVAKAAAGASK